ncbi:MAG TPA: hypothetical protein VMN58_09745 [Acidimicrobiales bacterium]|nr:hypothetical protein [Acidimicrobiales bacterium]
MTQRDARTRRPARAGTVDPPWRRVALLTGWVAALVAVALGVGALGSGALAAPDLTSPSTWSTWAAERTPVEAAFAVLRLVVVALAWYLLVVTLLAVVARAGRAGRLVTVVDVVTLPLVRPMVHGAVGLGLVGATVAGVGAGQVSTGALVTHTTADARLASALGDPVPGGDVLRELPPHEGDGVPVMHRLPDDDAAPPSTTAAPEWEVGPGDHLWSVAARLLEESWGRSVTEDEVAPYWRTVVEANADRLVEPSNADLIFPGQILTVPTPPPPPTG